MIYDVFPFFNELDLLEIRLREFDDIPDVRHVIVESTMTFTGRPKDLHFLTGSGGRFRRWGDRIVSIVVTPPDGLDPWGREAFQRNVAMAYLPVVAQPDDVVILSDADEIVRWTVVADYAAVGSGPHALNLAQHCYWLDGRVVDETWPWPRICRYADLAEFGSLQGLRHSQRALPSVANAGWHFSWCGGVAKCQEKIRSFSHVEVDTPEFNDPERIRAAMEGSRQFWDSKELRFVPIDESYPKCLRDDPSRWAHLIHGVGP